MTKKSVEILGLPVISITEGRELGTSKTLVIDARRGAVAAITIEDEDWYRGVKLLPYSSVTAIGHDAVTVTGSENILTLEEASDFEAMLDENIRIIGTKAMTKTGTIYGTVAEVFVGGDGTVEKILIATPDGNESEILSDEIAIFGKQVTVIGEPGDGAIRQREAALSSASRASQPKEKQEAVPEPPENLAAGVAAEPERSEGIALATAPELPETFAAETVMAEGDEIREAPEPPAAEIAPAPELTEPVAPDILPEPRESALAEAADPETEFPEIIEPEVVPELMQSFATEPAPAPEPAPGGASGEKPDLAQETKSVAEESTEMPAVDHASAPEVKPKARRRKSAAKPKKAEESSADPTEESAETKPKTRRKPKKAAEPAPEPTEELVLEMEAEPEPQKKSSARSKKAASAAPEAETKATMNRQRRFLLGKRAARDIAMESGETIVNAGDEITEEIMEKAQAAGKLIELSMSAR